jgi:quercetin dioxygenase-like cupin family protein
VTVRARPWHHGPMGNEPSYLPLLRKIANAECNAEVFLSAWAAATPRDDVRRVIGTVALREAEHAKAFEKRICELGFDVTIEEAPQTAGRAAIAARADLTDGQKFEELGVGMPADPSTPDRWASYLGDNTIDIATSELLGRFVGEERDSVRMLAECRGALAEEERSTAAKPETPAKQKTKARLDRIEQMLEQVVARLDSGTNTATVSEKDFRAGLRNDGFDDEIRITQYEPGVTGELHCHDFSARVLVLEGAFVLNYEDGPQTFTAGQCCQLDAGTMHAECTGGIGARVLAGLKHPTAA